MGFYDLIFELIAPKKFSLSLIRFRINKISIDEKTILKRITKWKIKCLLLVRDVASQSIRVDVTVELFMKLRVGQLCFKSYSGYFYCFSNMSRNKYSDRAKGVNCNKPFRKEISSGFSSTPDHPVTRKHDDKRSKPPPGLKGKALGLWYRDRNRIKEPKSVTVALKTGKKEEIENVLLAVGNVSSRKSTKIEDGSFEAKFIRDRDIGFEESLNKITVGLIKPDHDMDNKLYDEYKAKTANKDYRAMLEFRKTLPAYKKKEEIMDAINRNQIVLVSGETGCGKTTQVVQYVLDNYIVNKKGSLFKAICTQPRRISAISVAERVAAERAESLGTNVGYVIRLQSELPTRSRGTITFVTTGVLIQWLQSNPLLEGISHLCIDEVHERSTFCDFLLALLKYILPKRPDLKVVLMSATVDSNKISQYFNGVPCIEIPGFTYFVEEIYLEDILQKVPFKFLESYSSKKNLDCAFRDYVLPYVNNLKRNNEISISVARELANPNSEKLNVDFIAQIIHYICLHEAEGAILVFVPGLAQILDIHRLLTKTRYFSSSRALIIPMHSIISSFEQKKAFSKPPTGVRKIIISTSICETSLTIDDVRYVIDCGKNKLQSFDLNKNLKILEPEWETLANAQQRKGRAGRTQSGKCYKLFTKAREQTFELYPLPEIQTCRLEEVILKAKTLRLGDVKGFSEKLLDPPDPKGVDLSLKMLKTLNLLDSDERLTPLGYHVSKLPLDPQTGKMMLMGALFSCVDPILSIAACLSFKDPFEFVFGKEELVRKKREECSLGEKSDHLMLSNALMSWEMANDQGHGFEFARDNFLSHHNLKLLSNMKKQFGRFLYEMKFIEDSDPKNSRNNINSFNASLVKAIVCSGLYPNVAMIKKIIKSKADSQPKFILWKTVDHPRVQFHLKSTLEKVKHFESPFVVYFEKIKSSAVFLHDATMVYPMALLFFGEKCDIVKDCGYYIRVDDMIKFSCDKRTAELVQKLRVELLWIIEQAALSPAMIDWQKKDQKTLILNSVVELIKLEGETPLYKPGVDFE